MVGLLNANIAVSVPKLSIQIKQKKLTQKHQLFNQMFNAIVSARSLEFWLSTIYKKGDFYETITQKLVCPN